MAFFTLLSEASLLGSQPFLLEKQKSNFFLLTQSLFLFESETLMLDALFLFFALTFDFKLALTLFFLTLEALLFLASQSLLLS